MTQDTRLEALELRICRLERSATRWRACCLGLAGLAAGGVLMAQQRIGTAEPKTRERSVVAMASVTTTADSGGATPTTRLVRVWSDGATDFMHHYAPSGQDVEWHEDSEAWYPSTSSAGTYFPKRAWRPFIDAAYPGK